MAGAETTLKVKLDTSECEEFIATLKELQAESRQLLAAIKAMRRQTFVDGGNERWPGIITDGKWLLFTPRSFMIDADIGERVTIEGRDMECVEMTSYTLTFREVGE